MAKMDIETYQAMEKLASDTAAKAVQGVCDRMDLKLYPIEKTLDEIHKNGCMMGMSDRARIDHVESCVDTIKENALIASSRPRQILTAGTVSVIIAILAGVLNYFGVKVETSGASSPMVTNAITLNRSH